MGKKVIRVALTTQGINKALRELERYKRDFLRKVELLRQRVAEELAKEAESGFNGALVDDLVKGTPRVAQVNVTVDDRGTVTAVIADGEDAVWVEFGAGVYHNGSPGSSPHPHGAELGFTIGGYGKGYGKKNVWGFYKDGELKLTHGTPAQMPMARAVITVCQDVEKIAREVFG